LALKDSGSGQKVTVTEGQKVAPAAAGAPAAPAAPSGEQVLRVPTTGGFQKGPDDALVTIVEFSDFECPFCNKVVPTLKQIQDTYGDKVRIVFKHNPLPFHANAPLASEYALAAGQQGKFWEMHDKLFENYKALQAPNLDGYAQSIGADVGKIKAYIESGEGKKQIQADQALAAKIGGRGTPAFYINGVKLSGAQPFDNFKAIIDQQLAKAEKLVSSGVPKKDVYAKIMASALENAPAEQPKPQQAEPPATRQAVALSDKAPTKGGKEPLVTIVEWSDFECPFCSRVTPTMKQIIDTYGDKVAFQFRHQPLSFHARAMPAAKASMAAHKQGKFWQMHDKLFENQKAIQDADLDRYAQEIGLNLQKFKADMASKEIEEIIQADINTGNGVGARGTPSFFVNGVPVRGAQPFPAFQKIIDEELKIADGLLKDGVKRKDIYAEILKRHAGKPAPGQPAQAAQPPPAPTGPVDVTIGKAPAIGPKDAPIKVVVFSDFECPFCGRVNPSIDRLKQEYKGKVQVAFKHYPLPFHRNAELAAVASLAAHRQGKFWEMHDKLFANQQALQRDSLVSYAKDLGLDVSKFQKDLDDPELTTWVKSDTEEGSKIGVRGTPATFVNGRLVSGAQPFEAFKAIVDEELKKKS
jgi:protein-disulfide isomerase